MGEDDGGESLRDRLSRWGSALREAAHGFHRGHSQVRDIHSQREAGARRDGPDEDGD